jgi:opacity protein-like surface antigen
LLKTLEYPNTYTYSATFLTTVGVIGNADLQLNRKSSIYSLMLNSYVDLPINNRFNFFFGGGIGIAQIKEKAVQKMIVNKIHVSEGKEKSKNKRNFAYSLTTGIS